GVSVSYNLHRDLEMEKDQPMEYRTLIPIVEELRDARIVLRPHTLAIADEMHAAIEESRDHLRPFLPFADQDIEGTRDFIVRSMAWWLLREQFAMGIYRLDQQRFIGSIGFHVRNWDTRYFEIGYWVRLSEQGQGFISDAVKLVVDYLFDHLG